MQTRARTSSYRSFLHGVLASTVDDDDDDDGGGGLGGRRRPAMPAQTNAAAPVVLSAKQKRAVAEYRRRQGVTPDVFTYNALISACGKSKQLERTSIKSCPVTLYAGIPTSRRRAGGRKTPIFV